MESINLLLFWVQLTLSKGLLHASAKLSTLADSSLSKPFESSERHLGSPVVVELSQNLPVRPHSMVLSTTCADAFISRSDSYRGHIFRSFAQAVRLARWHARDAFLLFSVQLTLSTAFLQASAKLSTLITNYKFVISDV